MLLAWVDVLRPSDLVKAALVATVALFVRAFSSPKAAVDEAHAAGYQAAVADVSALTGPPPPPLPPIQLPGDA
jgi:hypothetical protein